MSPEIHPNVAAKAAINGFILQQTHGVVIAGPFNGMAILPIETWADGNYGTKLLGCYEAELHELIDREIKRLNKLDAPVIVNIGSAEGYYAVGMALRVPQATVYLVEPEHQATRVAHANAEMNNVTLYSHRCFGEIMQSPDLVICDCEGHEIEYLDLEKFPALRRATIICEVHDSVDQPTTYILLDRFRHTHHITARYEGARNPNFYDCLKNKTSTERWLAMNEGRPVCMHWFDMVPREIAAND